MPRWKPARTGWKACKVIDAALEAGANRLEGVTFGLSDELPHQTRALELAAQQARTKAQALAAALDVELDGLHKINAGPVFVPYPTARFDMAETMAARAVTPVQPGEIEVRASVTLEYRIYRIRR